MFQPRCPIGIVVFREFIYRDPARARLGVLNVNRNGATARSRVLLPVRCYEFQRPRRGARIVTGRAVRSPSEVATDGRRRQQVVTQWRYVQHIVHRFNEAVGDVSYAVQSRSVKYASSVTMSPGVNIYRRIGSCRCYTRANAFNEEFRRRSGTGERRHGRSFTIGCYHLRPAQSPCYEWRQRCGCLPAVCPSSKSLKAARLF